MLLNYKELLPSSNKVKKIVILCHGYGADYHDLFKIAEYWQRFLPEFLFICPNAPSICQINPSGFEWFDLMQTSHEKILSEFEKSLLMLAKLIENKLNKYKLEKKDLFLMGFSQGTMMSLQTALCSLKPVAGVLGYSGKIFDINYLEKKIFSKPPIFLFHGNIDTIVSLEEMYKTYDFLKEKSFDIQNKVFDNCGHTITPEGLSLGLKFIKSKSTL